jgi:hypothetical protein
MGNPVSGAIAQFLIAYITEAGTASSLRPGLAAAVLLLQIGTFALVFLMPGPNASSPPSPPQSMTFAAAATPGSVWWVGATSTDSSALPNTGVRGTFQVISFQVAGCLAFWVAEDLSDNVWGQVGYYLCGGATPVAFYQIWNLNSNTVLTTGTSYVTTGTHTFSMYLQSGTTWAYALDGTSFGTYDMGASSSSTTYPVQALSEEEGNTTFAFPTVTFSTALQVLSGSSWGSVQTANSYGNAWGVQANLQNSALAGDQMVVGGSLAAIPQGTALWSTASTTGSGSTSTSSTSTTMLPPVTSTVTTTTTVTSTPPPSTTTSAVTSTQTVTNTATVTHTSTVTTGGPTTATTTVTSTAPVDTRTVTQTQTSTTTVTSTTTATGEGTAPSGSSTTVTSTVTQTQTSTTTQTVTSTTTPGSGATTTVTTTSPPSTTTLTSTVTSTQNSPQNAQTTLTVTTTASQPSTQGSTMTKTFTWTEWLPGSTTTVTANAFVLTTTEGPVTSTITSNGTVTTTTTHYNTVTATVTTTVCIDASSHGQVQCSSSTASSRPAVNQPVIPASDLVSLVSVISASLAILVVRKAMISQ